MEIMLTPRFFDNHINAWSPTKAEPNHYVSLAFNAVTYSGTPWNNNNIIINSNMIADGVEYQSKEPPTIIYVLDEVDNVSLLNDDPDEDDDQLLPPSTYDVLVPLLDEMYKDESEVYDDEQETTDLVDSLPWNEEEVMADGARAA